MRQSLLNQLEKRTPLKPGEVNLGILVVLDESRLLEEVAQTGAEIIRKMQTRSADLSSQTLHTITNKEQLAGHDFSSPAIDLHDFMSKRMQRCRTLESIKISR